MNDTAWSEVVQGRRIGAEDVEWVRRYVAENPQARRKRIALDLCKHWGWKNGRGHWKEMAARELLNKLSERGLVRLPPRRSWVRRKPAQGRAAVPVCAMGDPVQGVLHELLPVKLSVVAEGSRLWRRWAGYLRGYHYLGLRMVGENLGYLVEDRQGRDVAALLFGAAAWRCAARDAYLRGRSQAPLEQIANNTRFLVLPWVRVPHLASHVLGLVQRRIDADWREKYGHGLEWLETFVDVERFRGTCYRAANWREVGRTQGRSRQDREHRMHVSIKAVFLYPVGSGQRRCS
jgi:hypothetical protein